MTKPSQVRSLSAFIEVPKQTRSQSITHRQVTTATAPDEIAKMVADGWEVICCQMTKTMER